MAAARPSPPKPWERNPNPNIQHSSSRYSTTSNVSGTGMHSGTTNLSSLESNASVTNHTSVSNTASVSNNNNNAVSMNGPSTVNGANSNSTNVTNTTNSSTNSMMMRNNDIYGSYGPMSNGVMNGSSSYGGYSGYGNSGYGSYGGMSGFGSSYGSGYGLSYSGGYGGYGMSRYGGYGMSGYNGMGGRMPMDGNPNGPLGHLGWLSSFNQIVCSLGQITELLGMNAEALNFSFGCFVGFMEKISGMLIGVVHMLVPRPVFPPGHPRHGEPPPTEEEENRRLRRVKIVRFLISLVAIYSFIKGSRRLLALFKRLTGSTPKRKILAQSQMESIFASQTRR